MSDYAKGTYAFGFCDRCGFRCPLGELRALTIARREVDLRVCNTCYEDDHPQLSIGLVDMRDPQALRNPRPDTGLQDSRELTGDYDPATHAVL